MSDPAPPSELVERARQALTRSLYEQGMFELQVGECPVEAFREAMRAALAALPAAGAAMELREALELIREAREQRDEANQMIAMLCDEKIKPLQKECARLRAALASAPARDATPAAPSGEYARAIEDALARAIEIVAKQRTIYDCITELEKLRGAALAPAPREDARLPSPTPPTGA